MKVFVAGVSAERQYVRAISSFNAVKLRPGDERAYLEGQTGYTARVRLGNEFYRRKEFDALLMLDMDMLHDEMLLERLREHDLDMVTAHYFRRQTNPMRSIIQVSEDGEWPYTPIRYIPDSGLMQVATTGMGCVLIKREVYEAVLEDIPDGSHPFDIGTLPWFTGDHGAFGQDFRFFAWARKLGYKLWLDCTLESLHGATLWLSRDLYRKLGHSERQATEWGKLVYTTLEMHGMNEKALRHRLEQLEMVRDKVAGQLEKVQDQLKVLDGQIAENRMYLQKVKQNREVELPDGNKGRKIANVPVFGSEEEVEKALNNRGKGPEGVSEEELRQRREEGYRDEAEEFIEALDDQEDG